MQSVLSNTACAKPALTDAVEQTSTTPAAAAGAQLSTDTLTQTAASNAMQAAVTYSSANSRSEMEQSNLKEINKGCVNKMSFIPEDKLPHIRKIKEKTLDYIVKTLHSKHEPQSLPMQAVQSDNDFYDDFEVIDKDSPMEDTKNKQESYYLLKIHTPADTIDFEVLNNESEPTQQDKDAIMTQIDPIMTSLHQKTNRETNLASNDPLVRKASCYRISCSAVPNYLITCKRNRILQAAKKEAAQSLHAF